MLQQIFQFFNESKKSGAHWVHNNWIEGKWRKRFRFEKEGIWKPTGRLNGTTYDCAAGEIKHLKKRLPSVNVNLVPAPVIEKKSDETKTLKQNHTLVVLLGSIRGGEPTWSSLYENLLDPNNADLALVMGSDLYQNSSSLYQRAKFVWEFPEYSDWSRAVDELFGTKESDEHSWRQIARATTPSGPFSGTNEDPHGSGVINGLARVFLMEKLTSLGLLDEYDRFVITRADQYYPCGLDLTELDHSKVEYIEDGERPCFCVHLTRF